MFVHMNSLSCSKLAVYLYIFQSFRDIKDHHNIHLDIHMEQLLLQDICAFFEDLIILGNYFHSILCNY